MTPRRPQHYRRLWQTLAWLLLTAVVVLSLTPKPPSDGVGWDKANHLIAYGALCWWFAQAVTGPARAALLLFAVGVALEFAQQLTGRSLELADMLANALGVGLGWLLALGPSGRLLAWGDRLLYRQFGPMR